MKSRRKNVKGNAVDAMRNVIMNSNSGNSGSNCTADQYRAAVEDLPRGEAEYP
ncbi:MAG: hypothetical protein ACLSWD_11495 [Clostridium sp.]